MAKERDTPTGSSYRPRVFVPLNSKFPSRDCCFHIHDCFAKRFPLRSDFGLYETQGITFRLSSHHCLLFFLVHRSETEFGIKNKQYFKAHVCFGIDETGVGAQILHAC